ncbi:hypothetical protein M3Y95_00344600 [Aphelenchoides besseyi]|nr:hypothetical protein M3Y95_00344600 [Aphelenchoides besseyi]
MDTALNQKYAAAHNCPNLTHQIVLYVYIVPVTFFNLLLLYFIRSKTIDSMREYKMVLYTTTIIDFASAWLQFLIGIRPTLENDNQTYNFDGFLPQLVANWSIFSGGNLHYLALMETFAADFSFAFGIMPFCWRYFAVCWDWKLKGWQFLILTCCTAWLALWSSLSFAFMSAQYYEQNSPGVLMDPRCLRSMTSYTGAQSESQTGLQNWLIRGWFYGLAGNLYSYAIVFIAAWRIYANVKKQAFISQSKKAIRTQRQLTLTIGLQALCPMVVTGTSLIWLYIGIKAEFHKEDSFVILFYSFMVFPILNPMISLLFISSYRRSLIDFGRWMVGKPQIYGGWRRNGVSPSTMVVSKLRNPTATIIL